MQNIETNLGTSIRYKIWDIVERQSKQKVTINLFFSCEAAYDVIWDDNAIGALINEDMKFKEENDKYTK